MRRAPLFLLLGLLLVFTPSRSSASIFDIFKRKSSPVSTPASNSSSTKKSAPASKSTVKTTGKSTGKATGKAAAKPKLKTQRVCKTVTVIVKKKKVKKTTCTTVSISDVPDLRAKRSNPNLIFGITIHPNGQYAKVADDQIALLKDLGVKLVKLDYINRLGAPENDIYVNKLVAAGIEPVLVIDWQSQDHVPSNTIESEQFAYALGNEVGARYKGKVKYFQLSGEMENQMLKGSGYNGIDSGDYEMGTVLRFLPWIRGSLNGIKDGNPDAQRVMSFQYTHTGILDLLTHFGIMDRVEIIGWNIYSDQASELERVKVGDSYVDVLSNLAGRKKAIWLTEVAKRHGSTGNTQVAQAQYLQQVANYVKQTPEISAFLAFEFGDEPERALTHEDQYGFVTWDFLEGGALTNVQKKVAFDAYKQIIADWAVGK